MWNKKESIMTDPTGIEKIIGGYYEKLYANKFDNLEIKNIL